jgi:pyridoxamine 5'-phosphate oxidase
MVQKKDVSDLRREYLGDPLCKEAVKDDPIEQFELWFQQALETDLTDANAMTLATVSPERIPSARTVLLKGIDEDGFQFYTNYESRKGRDLTSNQNVSLCFRWSELERQVRIQGRAEKMSRKDSATYFKKRPRPSQLSAWASAQSREIKSRKALEENFETMKKRFADREVPLPDFWGGYVVRPVQIEFWEGRPNRLHDRILYKRENNSWKITRLAP